MRIICILISLLTYFRDFSDFSRSHRMFSSFYNVTRIKKYTSLFHLKSISSCCSLNIGWSTIGMEWVTWNELHYTAFYNLVLFKFCLLIQLYCYHNLEVGAIPPRQDNLEICDEYVITTIMEPTSRTWEKSSKDQTTKKKNLR